MVALSLLSAASSNTAGVRSASESPLNKPDKLDAAVVAAIGAVDVSREASCATEPPGNETSARAPTRYEMFLS